MQPLHAVVAFLATAFAHSNLPSPDTVINRVTFSSCMHQDPAGFGDDNIFFGGWDTWRNAQGDLAILAGDNVYGDCSTPSCTELKEAYADLAAIEPFQRFKAEQAYVATWDDHDYGVNNGGADFFGKETAKEEFLSFWDVPADDPRRSREGIYMSYEFGPNGQRLQVIVLDQRWFKTDETILGAEQWAWLEAEFAKPADLRIVVASFQFLGNLYEGWYEYYCEQKRMLGVLPDNVIFVSGDRHIGGFYQLDAYNGAQYGWTDNNGQRVPPMPRGVPGETAPLLEVTSSSLTHTWNEAGVEEGPNRVPGLDIVRTDNFGQMDIDWTARTAVVFLLPANPADPAQAANVRTLTVSFPPPKPEAPPPCPPGCNSARRLLFASRPSLCPDECVDADAEITTDTCAAVCVPWVPDDTTATLTASGLLQRTGATPADPLMYMYPNVTVSAIATAGEYVALSSDSFWQVPASWEGLSLYSGPADGQGAKMLAPGLVRFYINNEVAAATGTSAMTYKVSAVADKGGPGQAFPLASEHYEVTGAPVIYRDYEVESKSNVTTYSAVAGGIAIKRLLVSTDTEPEGHLITSRDEMSSLLNGLVGFSRACGARFSLKHQFGYVSVGAGFEDEMYIGGHEDGIFGAFFALDPASGNTYLVPMPAEVELATPLYAGRADYVAMAVSVYPEPSPIGQRIHLWIGQKTGTDFLSRNGLNPAHAMHYVLVLDEHSSWDSMAADAPASGRFVPISNATGALSSGSAKNEWGSANPWDPTMYALSLTGLDDIAIIDVDMESLSFDCTSTAGSPVPCTVAATAKRMRVQETDPIFGDPDGIYWSPKEQLIIAEDGATGRLLRMDLDKLGNSNMNLTTLARVADESERTALNSVPAFSLEAPSQAEFTGIIAHGFFHKLNADSNSSKWLEEELAAKEQYLVNLQLHSLSAGIIKYFTLGESTQTLRVDVEADPVGGAPDMYAWSGVSFYNARRDEYCAENDCASERGPFVAGEVVRVSDFEALEKWRGLPAGTYTEDLQAIVDESLGYNNLEPALPYAWSGVSFYNARRAEYCANNDCASERGEFVSGDIVLESDFAALEKWRGLPAGTYTEDIQAIVDESLGYNNLEPALPYVWLGVSFYNARRAEYCASNDCASERGEFIPGAVVLESDFAALEKWRGLPEGTYTEDIQAIVDESLGYNNLEPAGF